MADGFLLLFEGGQTDGGGSFLGKVAAPSREMRDGELLYNEPKYIRMDGDGLRTLKTAGLKLRKGVSY